MSWKDKYDKINRTWDGDVFCFGGHYNTEQVRNIINKEEWDDASLYVAGEHVWIRFQLVNNPDGDDKAEAGWMVLYEKPKSMSGCIEATEIKESSANEVQK